MVKLIKQQKRWDCTHACLAMWAGVEYKVVREKAESLRLYEKGLSEIEFKVLSHSFGIKPFTIDTAYGGLDGILSFPSLNKPGGAHALFYDDEKIYDPSPNLTYPEKLNGPWPGCYLLTINLNDEYSAEMAGQWLEYKQRLFDDGKPV